MDGGNELNNRAPVTGDDRGRKTNDALTVTMTGTVPATAELGDVLLGIILRLRSADRQRSLAEAELRAHPRHQERTDAA